MKLRQCVFVAKDLESSREELCDILGIEVAYRDPGVAKWGLVNVVCPIGHDFLEIVTPFQQGTSAGRAMTAGFSNRQVPDGKPRRCGPSWHEKGLPSKGHRFPAGGTL